MDSATCVIVVVDVWKMIAFPSEKALIYPFIPSLVCLLCGEIGGRLQPPSLTVHPLRAVRHRAPTTYLNLNSVIVHEEIVHDS